ncbi:g6446 [Coccomyxa viridis]|uniref:G6446 protein n=1 Tax=Coccomyxa viridis TaxID=1274662 RepID=A0ABP1FXQ5_9CHLO
MAAADVAHAAATTVIQNQAEVCWVCLGESTCLEPLCYPCKCPRPVHGACLARWQLHSAGSREEVACRFCSAVLPDWKPVLTPPLEDAAAACPTMSVTFNGQVHHVRVKGGPNGYADFVKDIQSIFGITTEHDMQLAFDCADPMTGLPMKLNGSGAYQAAVHCATISAAKRIRMWQQQQRRAPSSGLSSPAASSQIETPATPPRRNPGGVTHCLWDDYTLG